MKSTLAFVAALALCSSLASADSDISKVRRRHSNVARHMKENATLDEHNAALAKRGIFNTYGTFYEIRPGNVGACGGELSANGWTVALAQPMYGNLNAVSQYCGKTITISANGKSHTATIADACPTGKGNCGNSDLDMTQRLFEYFSPLGAGKIPITWVFGDVSAEEQLASSRSSALAASLSLASARASSLSAAASLSSVLASKSRASSLSKASKASSIAAAKSAAAAAPAAAATPMPDGPSVNLARLNEINAAFIQMASNAH